MTAFSPASHDSPPENSRRSTPIRAPRNAPRPQEAPGSRAGAAGRAPRRTASAATLSMIAASVTVRTIGPAVSWLWAIGMIPAWATSPTVGLSPTIALLPAGQTIEPSVSVPTAIAHRLAAAATADPELEPQGSSARPYGLRVKPPRALQPLRMQAGVRDRRRDQAAEVGPFRQVRLAEHDGPGRPQAGHDRRVARHPAADQRERARGRLHRVVGRDVVLEQDRDAVQRTAAPAGPSLGVTPRGDLEGGRVGLDDRVEQRDRAARCDRRYASVSSTLLSAPEAMSASSSGIEASNHGAASSASLAWRQSLVDRHIVAARDQRPGRRRAPGSSETSGAINGCAGQRLTRVD